MELVLPSTEYKTSYIEAVKEFQADHDFPQMIERASDTFATLESESFETYVEKTLSQSKGENLPEGYMPQTTYWLDDEAEYIGTVRIRHRLDKFLKKFGGHIGYDIRPSKSLISRNSACAEFPNEEVFLFVHLSIFRSKHSLLAQDCVAAMAQMIPLCSSGENPNTMAPTRTM